jgi:hypothetical protein
MHHASCSIFMIGLQSILKIERFGINLLILNLSKNSLIDLSPLRCMNKLLELDVSDNKM